MNLSRRNFLKSSGIILAAPAIVKAENLMKIWTPPKDIVIPDITLGLPENLRPGYFNLSFWAKEEGSGWINHQQTVHIQEGQTTITFPKTFKKSPTLTGVQLESGFRISSGENNSNPFKDAFYNGVRL